MHILLLVSLLNCKELFLQLYLYIADCVRITGSLNTSVVYHTHNQYTQYVLSCNISGEERYLCVVSLDAKDEKTRTGGGAG